MKIIMQELNCGNIVRVECLYHKGTDLYNGYRRIGIENINRENIPQYIRIKKGYFRTFLPLQRNNKCGKCLEEGHTDADCKNDWVCRYCKNSGHKAFNCPKKEADFPVLRVANQQIEKQSEENIRHENKQPNSTETEKKDDTAEKPKPKINDQITNGVTVNLQNRFEKLGNDDEEDENDFETAEQQLAMSTDSESDQPEPESENKQETSSDEIFSEETKIEILNRWKTATPRKKKTELKNRRKC